MRYFTNLHHINNQKYPFFLIEEKEKERDISCEIKWEIKVYIE